MPTLTLTLSVDLPSNLFQQNEQTENSLPIDTNAKILEFNWDQPNIPNLSNCSLQLNLPNFESTPKPSSKPLPIIPKEQPSNGLQLIQSPTSPNSKYINLNGRHSIGRTSLPPRNRSSKIQKVSLSDILDDVDSSGISMSRATTSSSTASLTRLTPQGPRPLLDGSPPLSYPIEMHKSAPSSINPTTHRRSSSLAANFGKSNSITSKKGFINTCNNLLKKSSFQGLSLEHGSITSEPTEIGDLSRLQSKSECPSLANSVEDLSIEDVIKPRRKSLDLGDSKNPSHQQIIRPRNESLYPQRPLTVYWAETPLDRFPIPKSSHSSPRLIPNRSVSLAKKRTGNSKPGSIFARNKSHKSVSSIFGPLEDRQPTGLEFLWEDVQFDKQVGSVRWSKLEHLNWFKLNGGKLGSDLEDEGLVISDSKLTNSPSKNTDMRYLVSLELLTTESSYLSSLQYMISAYQTPLVDRSPSPISPDDLNSIFFTINQLLKLSQTLEFILGTVIDENTWNSRNSCIGPIFLDLKDDWNLLLKYCKNYTNTQALVKKLLNNNAQFKAVMDDGNQKNPNKQKFLDLMILPIQRLTRYSLLLNAIKKHTNPSHPDHPYLIDALQLLEGLGMEANLANSLNPVANNSKATQELHLSVKNCPTSLIIPSNSKLITTEAHDLITDRRVKMFCFDNILIIAIARKKWQLMKTGDRWKYLTTLQINHLHLIKVVDSTGKLLDPPVALAMSQPKSPSISSLVSDSDSILKGSQTSSDSNFNFEAADCQYLALQFNTGKVYREWLSFIMPKLTSFTY